MSVKTRKKLKWLTISLSLVALMVVGFLSMGQDFAGKYWLANNPNAQITNAEVTALALLTQTEIEILDDASVTAAELTLLGTMNNVALDSLADLSAAELDVLDGINGAASGFWEGAPIIGDPSLGFYYMEDFIATAYDSADGLIGGAGSVGLNTAGFNATLPGWKSFGNTGWTMTQAAGSVGGMLVLTTLTGSNNEFTMQLGELGTETFVEIVESSGDKLWFEVSMAEADTSAGANFFVGFAEEGITVSDGVVNDAGNDVNDDDYLGFICWEDKPDTVEVFYQTNGGTFVDTFGYKIGEGQHKYQIYFDGDSTITFSVDGTTLGTVEQDTKLFPDTEELSPVIHVKEGDSGDKLLTIDYIKLVVKGR